MSPKTSSPSSNSISDAVHQSSNEWVEIIEPKSKKRIYANLESGACAKYPPEGAIVSRSEDFSDHWWELYDQKTGKYYYYNPEQQKTAWARPKETSSSTNGDGNCKRLLVIPVSKLQTFKKFSPGENEIDRCDASTQTVASNLVSTGTQTISESKLAEEFKDRLRVVDTSADNTSKPNSCTHASSINRSHLNHRQMSDFNGRDNVAYLKSQHHRNTTEPTRRGNHVRRSPPVDKNRSSQQKISINDRRDQSTPELEEDYIAYFGPRTPFQKERAPITIKSPSKQSPYRSTEYPTSTSTFGNPANAVSSSRTSVNNKKPPQIMTTNNLSHYLVSEARAMGIALISDDELDDDDQESDYDHDVGDDDDDTDLRDDTSSHRDAASDLNASQDLCENSSEGWKSFSDQDSPNNTAHPPTINAPCNNPSTFNELIDDQKDPVSCMSQQLDHRKLVENFKKSRQTSSFGLQDSLGRSNKHDANQTVQRLKTVADGYFSHDKDAPNDKHLGQISTLSTLPRPHKDTKDKLAISKQEDFSPSQIDADYDVVEENCGYYSDSERDQALDRLNSSDKSGQSLKSKANISVNEPQSPSSHFDRNKSSRGSTFSVESFARENLSRHPRGGLLFNRKVKWSRMISWSKNTIKQPMISSVSSDLNADSIASFKLIQQFMGDRKVTMSKKYRQVLAQSSPEDQKEALASKTKSLGRSNPTTVSQNTNGATFTVPDRLRDELAYELVVRGCTKSALRDEIYVQLARQLTENPNQESTTWGLILMSIMLSYFSPSNKFSPFLLSFLETHTHQMAQDVCLPRLEKRLRQNWLTYCRKPADGREISIVRLSITKWPQYCGVFGESLEKIMSLQTCSPYLKTLRLPWILTTLGDKLFETGGYETEGIFRCAADHDLIAQLRLEIDCVDFRKITDAKQVQSLLCNVQDPHVIAGLLKLFFRQLYEPVFPSHLYETCLQSGHDGHMACRLFNERLPNLNKDVVAYLVRLLQNLSKADKVTNTKMDTSNLSMVWAPNLLRAPELQIDQQPQQGGSVSGSKWSIANGSIGGGDDHQQQPPAPSSVAQSQSMIFEQTRQEMQFIRALMVHLDTSFIENVV